MAHRTRSSICLLADIINKKESKIYRISYSLWTLPVQSNAFWTCKRSSNILMTYVLRDYLRKFCLVYLDDIIIYSKSLKDHRRHVKKVLQAIRSAGLKLKPAKCKWF